MTEEEKKIEETSEESSIETNNDEEKNDEVEEAVQEVDEKTKDRKKIQNLISAIILLAGLFVGSLFVDVAQMVRGGGFSERALSTTDVFSAAGKTWVAYTDPIVKVQVVNDETCGDACKPDDVLVGLKQVMPTMTTEKVDVNSPEGKQLVAQFNLKTLPAFIFSKDVEKTDLFAKAQPFLDKQGDFYAIKSAEAGFPVGKYIAAPQISNKDITLGNTDSKVKVVSFIDFQNPGDKQAWQTITSQMIKDYGDKIQMVFKNYFPAQSAQAMSAALASACANDQQKFAPFADKVFANQSAWANAKDAAPLMKTYAAQAGLDATSFASCLDGKKDQDLINQTVQDGQSFGLQASPSIFVGTDLQAATAKYDDIKKAIDDQLAK